MRQTLTKMELGSIGAGVVTLGALSLYHTAQTNRLDKKTKEMAALYQSKTEKMLSSLSDVAQQTKNLKSQAEQIQASIEAQRDKEERLQQIIREHEQKHQKKKKQVESLVQSPVAAVKKKLKAPKRAREILKYGWPSADNIKCRSSYVLDYDRAHRTAKWSCEKITADSLESAASRRRKSRMQRSQEEGRPEQAQQVQEEWGRPPEDPSRKASHFEPDLSVPAPFRASLEDYRGSGYDRGHLTPAGDVKSSQKALNETFLLSNVSPQVGRGFNRDYWGRVEQFVRELAHTCQATPLGYNGNGGGDSVEHKQDGENVKESTGTKLNDGVSVESCAVYCCTGPLYLPQKDPQDGRWYVRYEVLADQQGEPNVSVPTHFFKTVLVEQKLNYHHVTSEEMKEQKKESPAVRGHQQDTSDVHQIQLATAAFVVPNAPIPKDTKLREFEVGIGDLERMSGLEFFREAFTSPLGPRTGDESKATAHMGENGTGDARVAASHECGHERYAGLGHKVSVTEKNKTTKSLSAVQWRPLSKLCAQTDCTLPPPDWWTKGKAPEDELSPEDIRKKIEDFLDDEGRNVLEFPASLTPRERRKVHSEASKMNLEHFSKGSGMNRKIVVAKRQ